MQSRAVNKSNDRLESSISYEAATRQKNVSLFTWWPPHVEEGHARLWAFYPIKETGMGKYDLPAVQSGPFGVAIDAALSDALAAANAIEPLYVQRGKEKFWANLLRGESIPEEGATNEEAPRRNRLGRRITDAGAPRPEPVPDSRPRKRLGQGMSGETS